MFPLTSGKKVTTQKNLQKGLRTCLTNTFLRRLPLQDLASYVYFCTYTFIIMCGLGPIWPALADHQSLLKLCTEDCKLKLQGAEAAPCILKDFASFFCKLHCGLFFLLSFPSHHSYLRNGLFLKPKRNYFKAY